MKLREYMELTSIGFAGMAEAIGGVSTGAVRKWAYGERTPRNTVMPRIIAATNGAVTANDFLPAPLVAQNQQGE